MHLLEFRILKLQFSAFSLTCFDILSWNFAYDFVLLFYRSNSSVINWRQLLWELCPFWNLEYWKYTVFRTFLTYMLWHIELKFYIVMTLFYCTTDQVRVSSIRLVGWLVGWLVVLRTCVALAVFQPYRDLEAGDNQCLKFKWRGGESNPGPLALQAKSLTTRPPPLLVNSHQFL